MDGYEDLPGKGQAADPYADIPAKTKDTYEQVSAALRKAMPEGQAPSRFMGPILTGGLGELTRGAGALTQLVAPETGKKISDVGKAMVDVTRERYPVKGTAGQFGSYMLPYGAAEKALGTVIGGAGLGAQALRGGLAGGGVGALTTEGSAGDRAIAGALGGALGAGATYGTALASKGYQWTKNTLQKAFGGEEKRLAELLRQAAGTKAGEEAAAARRMAEEIERDIAKSAQTASTAERAAGRAERQVEGAYGELPGVQTTKEAGRFKPIPESTETVGQRLKDVVGKFVDAIKSRRSELATKNFEAAFNTAKAQEAQGNFVQNTKEFKAVTDYIDGRLKVITDPALRRELETVRTAITKGISVELSEGERRVLALRQNIPLEQVPARTNLPTTFEGLEIMRRRIGDAAFGTPQEGYQAIGQDIAREIYSKLSDSMKAYSSDFAKYLADYARLSEPLRVTGSRVGKALVDEQLHGKGANYAAVAAADIPGRVFKNRESYTALIDALGGNKQLAEAEAKKYFASQLEGLKGNASKIEDFISKNRSMLTLTNSKEMVEAYLAQARSAASRAAAGAERAKTEQAAIATKGPQAEKLKGIATDFERIESEMRTARTPDEVARMYDRFATKLFSDNKITQQQYEQMMNQGREVLQATADKKEAVKRLLGMTWRSVIGTGALGAGTYGAVRYFGER